MLGNLVAKDDEGEQSDGAEWQKDPNERFHQLHTHKRQRKKLSEYLDVQGEGGVRFFVHLNQRHLQASDSLRILHTWKHGRRFAVERVLTRRFHSAFRIPVARIIGNFIYFTTMTTISFILLQWMAWIVFKNGWPSMFIYRTYPPTTKQPILQSFPGLIRTGRGWPVIADSSTSILPCKNPKKNINISDHYLIIPELMLYPYMQLKLYLVQSTISGNHWSRS